VSNDLMKNIENQPIFIVMRLNYTITNQEKEIKEEKILRIWKLSKEGIQSVEHCEI